MPPIIFSLTYDVVQSGLILAFCGYSSRPIVCPLLALSGHRQRLGECPLSGVKRTSPRGQAAVTPCQEPAPLLRSALAGTNQFRRPR
jgi:hypothetical protein